VKLYLLIIAIFCIITRLVIGVETLTFDASTTPNVGYVLKWGTNQLGVIGSLALDTNRVAKLTNGPFGAYYFKVTAFANNGTESDFSNVLLATNRPNAPINLRIIGPTDALLLQASASAAGPWKSLAVITSTNTPLVLAPEPKQMFRAIITNAPPPFPH
jgi:hypothetical protein